MAGDPGLRLLLLPHRGDPPAGCLLNCPGRVAEVLGARLGLLRTHQAGQTGQRLAMAQTPVSSCPLPSHSPAMPAHPLSCEGLGGTEPWLGRTLMRKLKDDVGAGASHAWQLAARAQPGAQGCLSLSVPPSLPPLVDISRTFYAQDAVPGIQQGTEQARPHSHGADLLWGSDSPNPCSNSCVTGLVKGQGARGRPWGLWSVEGAGETSIRGEVWVRPERRGEGRWDSGPPAAGARVGEGLQAGGQWAWAGWSWSTVRKGLRHGPRDGILCSVTRCWR